MSEVAKYQVRYNSFIFDFWEPFVWEKAYKSLLDVWPEFKIGNWGDTWTNWNINDEDSE